MENRTKLSTILIILFAIVFGSFQLYFNLNSKNLSANPESIQNHTFKQLKSSNSWILSPIVIDDTGSGNYTWEKAVLQPWCSGSGTQNIPFIIENIFIDAGNIGNCITIQNSNKHFILRNSTFVNSGWEGKPPYNAGIILNTVINGKLINNTCSSNMYGISIYKTDGIIIQNNIIKNNDYGLAIVEGNFNEFMNNSLTLIVVGDIYTFQADNNIIKENTFKNGRMGIFFDGDSSNNIIKSNKIQIYTENAIEITPSNNNNNKISENVITQVRNGILLRGGNRYNNISYNNISHSLSNGILLKGVDSATDNNLILRNRIFNSSGYGISLVKNCIFNIINDNEIINNSQVGIRIADSDCRENMIYKNSFITNNKHALDLGSSTYWNDTEIGNFWDNYTGYDFNDDGIGDIPYNISMSPLRQDMLPIWDDGDDPIPQDLTIITPNENQEIGYASPAFEIYSKSIYIDSMWYNLNNTSINHTFSGFTGIINQIIWNQFTEGNITITFYANDTLGYIGSAEIIVEKDTTLPIIIINSPMDNDVFATEPPNFNVTIIEKNPLYSWYTIEGIAGNFYFTELNGTIDQDAWNSIPQGELLITFYAEDAAGNIGTNSVIIKKSIPSKSAILGYDIFLLIGLISLALIVTIKKLLRTKKYKIS